MGWGSTTTQTVKRSLARFGIKAGIVVAGVIVAAGTVHRATYLPQTSLAKRIVTDAPVNLKTPWGTSIAAASSVAPGGLDAGLNHDRIQYWVTRLSTTLAGDFGRMLQRKAKYSDMIAAKLEAKQMPRDLVYLAMIESEFNPNARSPVKAVGLWQFMSGTARRFGLRVRGHVDERRDPDRETDAAVQYLSALHTRFGSWYLAAAAYNSGEGTVLRALRSVTGKTTGTDDDFFRILPDLPKETQDYVPKLIAAARVGNAPAKYGIPGQTVSATGEIEGSGAPDSSAKSAALGPATTPAASATPTAHVGKKAADEPERASTSKRKTPAAMRKRAAVKGKSARGKSARGKSARGKSARGKSIKSKSAKGKSVRGKPSRPKSPHRTHKR